MYKVSVVITTHNRLNMLKKAIKSVEMQSYSNIEIVIVNDNSDDGTKEYLDKLVGENIVIKHLYGSQSRGGNHARNVGINTSTGDLIAFLDDDDFWNVKKIEKQVAIFKKDSKIGLVYCGYERITNQKIRTKVMPDYNFKGKIGNNALTKIFSITSCLVVKKVLLEEIGGFDERLSHWQEYDLSIRISQICDIDFVDECLVTIISITNDPSRLSNQVEKWKSSMKYFDTKYQYLINELTDEQLLKKEMTFYLDGASRYAAVGNKRMHRKYMKIVWRKSGKIHHFIRYLFNLDNVQVEKIKFFLQNHSINIEKLKKI